MASLHNAYRALRLSEEYSECSVSVAHFHIKTNQKFINGVKVISSLTFKDGYSEISTTDTATGSYFLDHSSKYIPLAIF